MKWLRVFLTCTWKTTFAPGLSREAARRDALLKLGGIEALKESHRVRRGLPDAGHAARPGANHPSRG
jgi:hypothetical protein